MGDILLKVGIQFDFKWAIFLGTIYERLISELTVSTHTHFKELFLNMQILVLLVP
jgi:hypothetical protein